MRIRLTESDLERFWAKVEIRGEHECWPWQGSIHKSGYGHFRVGGKYGQIREAHALICEYFQGPFVGEVHVRHSCDNPVCCNPNHLIPGSRQENIDDMVAKGRNRSPRLGNGHPKLGPEDYREIADLYRGGENKSALARRFGVTPPRIRQILKEYGLSDMGMHTVASAIIGSQQKWERKPADFYPSPYNVTQVLLDFLNLPEGTSIWEPAAGEGDMAAVMEVNGHDVWSTDIRKTSFIAGGVNFLTAKQLISPEWIITNPPFKVATEFIGHALSITPNVAMLLKSQFWHAASRVELFEKFPPAYVCPLTWRPSFLEKERGKSPLMDVIWVIWRGRSNVTEYRPLRRPSEDRMQSVKQAADNLLGRNLLGDFDDILGHRVCGNSTVSGGHFDDILG